MKKYVEIRIINQDDEYIYVSENSDKDLRIDGTLHPATGDELYIGNQKYNMTKISIRIEPASDTIFINIAVK